MSEITILDQAEMAELRAVEYRAHIDNLRHLRTQKKRTDDHVKAAEDRLPAIEAMARTLRALADNPAALDAARSIIRNAGEAP